MSPLVALLLFGFMFVIALSLTLWAALTVGDSRRGQEDEPAGVAYVPFGASRPVWREDANEPRVAGFERRAADSKGHSARRRSDVQPERRTGLPPPSGPAEGSELRVTPRVVSTPASGTESNATSVTAATDATVDRRNDEFRGARARVTQRPNNDDAFERFLDNERD